MPARVMALVQARDLEKHYVDGPRVVSVLGGLDLDVEPGERIAIVGESGVGKSTLLHLLGALDRPTRGQVLFDGEEIYGRREADIAAFRNREIGFVFQFHHLLPDFTALENVMLPGLIARESRSAVRSRAETLLARVGLKDRIGHRPGELSGGEQQRVAVARALARRPRLLLADEPTGNLDPQTAGGVQDLLLELNQEHGTAMVVATHSAHLAQAMMRTLRLTGGRLEPTEAAPLSVGGATS